MAVEVTALSTNVLQRLICDHVNHPRRTRAELLNLLEFLQQQERDLHHSPLECTSDSSAPSSMRLPVDALLHVFPFLSLRDMLTGASR